MGLKLGSFRKKIKKFRRWKLRSQTHKIADPHCRFLARRLMLNVSRSYFQVLESYNEKLLR